MGLRGRAVVSREMCRLLAGGDSGHNQMLSQETMKRGREAKCVKDPQTQHRKRKSSRGAGEISHRRLRQRLLCVWGPDGMGNVSYYGLSRPRSPLSGNRGSLPQVVGMNYKCPPSVVFYSVSLLIWTSGNFPEHGKGNRVLKA